MVATCEHPGEILREEFLLLLGISNYLLAKEIGVPAQRISDYQQLGFIKLLSAVSDPALLSDFMHDTLGCLIEPDRKSPWLLMETLETLLQESGNVVRAAERLGIHRNTLHQRIQRIEKLTGYPVSHPQFHLNASVALAIWRMSQNHLREQP